MGWFHRNNCAITCNNRAQFDEGAAQRINKQNGTGNHLHGMWINSIFCRYFQENLKPRATFFGRHTSTGSRLFAHLSHDFGQVLGQIVSLRVKTLSNKNLVLPRHIYLKEKKAYFWLTRVAQKRRLLKLPIDFEGEDCDWDSDYDNQRSEIVVKLI